MTKRDRMVIAGVALAALLGGFWFLVLGPKRQEAKTLGDQVASQQQRLTAAQSSLAGSQAARSTYQANYSTVARLGKAVPVDDDVPSLVYQLSRTADISKVDFRSVKLAPTGGSGSPAPPAPSANRGGASGAAAGTPAATPPATQAASATLPPGSAVGPAGFPTMPFSFAFEGSFFQLANLFGNLERYVVAKRSGVDVTGRLLQVNGISLTSGSGDFPRMKASVAATAYLLPVEQGLLNGASPASPAAPGSPQPASSTTAAPATAPATVTSPVK